MKPTWMCSLQGQEMLEEPQGAFWDLQSLLPPPPTHSKWRFLVASLWPQRPQPLLRVEKLCLLGETELNTDAFNCLGSRYCQRESRNPEWESRAVPLGKGSWKASQNKGNLELSLGEWFSLGVRVQRTCLQWGSIPGLGRSPGGGNDNPLQYSSLGNSMDRGTSLTTVHRVAKSWYDWATNTLLLGNIGALSSSQTGKPHLLPDQVLHYPHCPADPSQQAWC